MTAPQWRVFADAGALVAQAADTLCAEAAAAIAARGVFRLVLAGGNTPRELYRALSARDAGDARWQVWYGDERCLPAVDPERNSVMSDAAWLAASRIPPANRRPIPAEQGAQAAAALYGKWLKGVPDFDVVLLGMGEDGHTASLFPGHDWGDAPDGADVLAVHDSPKPPPQRVSLSAARLSRAQRVWFLITGSRKRDALTRWQDGEPLPVTSVKGKQETVVWLDAAAQP